MKKKDDIQKNEHSSEGLRLTSEFNNRLKQAIGSRSVLSFAQECGVSDSLVRKYLNNSLPGLDKAITMARVAGVSLIWLATGEGQPDGASQDTTYGLGEKRVSLEDLGDAYVAIPLYDIRASAEHDTLVETEKTSEVVIFQRQWLHKELHANPADLYLLHVDGESMQPTLRPGDVILIDRRAAQTVPRDGIYVLRMDESLLVKRLQRLPGRKVKVTSDNPAYESFELSLEAPDDTLTLIGRVVWSGRRM